MTETTTTALWWAVARSEEVTRSKPLSADIADQRIVLWRDQRGIARAIEDRCPHRRAPLSLGCIRDNGWIQCGYHGWSFDGETGRTMEIPNMKQAQKFPPLYRVATFAVHESAGFVRVCSQAGASIAEPEMAADSQTAMPLSGTVHVALAHEQYIAALFDDPSLLIGFRGLRFTPYLISDLRAENGWLMMERSCQRPLLRWPAAFSSEFPLAVLSSTHPHTGETHLTVRDRDFEEYVRVVLAPVPAGRGVTAVRWRAEVVRRRRGLHGLLFGAGSPVTVFEHIDAAALRALKPGVSVHGAQLRAQLLARCAPAAA